MLNINKQNLTKYDDITKFYKVKTDTLPNISYSHA